MAVAESRIRKRSYFFSAMQAGLSALQSAVILIAVSRTQEIETAGIVTIGFAIANLMMIIARYGIHNFQVTDIAEKYSFSDYFFSRIITVSITLLLSAVYIAAMTFTGKYTADKGMIIFEIILLKLTDAFEDVYVGRLQQQGRLDIGAGISAVRLAVSTLLIFACLWFASVPVSLLIGIVVSVVLDLILIPYSKKYADYQVGRMNREKIRSVMRVGLVLCLGMTMHNYVGNAPKYLVDWYLDDRIQAISGYIMMPMFTITVFNMFMVQPLVKTFGDAWHHQDKTTIRKMAGRHILLIVLFTILITVIGILIGLQVLSWFYRVELGSWKHEFTLLMIGGGIYTISSFFVVLLTVIRKQHMILGGCIVCTLIHLLLGRTAAERMGLKGLCLLYIAASTVMLVIFMFGVYKSSNPKTEGFYRC